MEATFKIKLHATEMSMDVYEKIRQFISLHHEESDIIINIRPKKKKAASNGTKEAYFTRLDKALANLDANKGVTTFSLDEFEKFADSKL